MEQGSAHDKLLGYIANEESAALIEAVTAEYADAIAERDAQAFEIAELRRINGRSLEQFQAVIHQRDDAIVRADRAEARRSSMMAERDDAREHVANWIAEADRERIIASRERAARAELERRVRELSETATAIADRLRNAAAFERRNPKEPTTPELYERLADALTASLTPRDASAGEAEANPRCRKCLGGNLDYGIEGAGLPPMPCDCDEGRALAARMKAAKTKREARP